MNNLINPSNTDEKKAEYVTALQSMDGPTLFKETKERIWLSAYANNNPRSCYHWQCDATYDEWLRRDGKTDQYAAAHAQVVAENC
jgi:hypothetical protein